MTDRVIRSRLDPNRQVTAPLVRWQSGAFTTSVDELAVEEPLDLHVQATSDDDNEVSLAAIMRTPGNDDELAVGFLYTEGLLAQRSELAGVRPGTDFDGLPSENILVVRAAGDIDLAKRARESGYSRLFAVNSSCGVCGKNSVSAACAVLPSLSTTDFSVPVHLLYSLPDQLRAKQMVFASTGGLHAAALFDRDAALLGLREDIGRHNAVDKLIGRALLDGELPLHQRILLVSGRLSFEIVLKALAAGIPIVAAVSAPSSLAVDLARAGGITVAAFLRGDHVNIYTHPERIYGEQAP
ncbi:MAG: formate dehydrogenase accessory sulfurtransferase FdhD [Ktedonobacterales bacterium]